MRFSVLNLHFFPLVVPAVLGLTAAAILAVSACFFARRLRRQQKKANGHEAAFTFQPPRPPRAVRSPSGQPPQYLKKSPSPTSVKLPPGHLTPPEASLATTKYTEEQEMVPKHSINGSRTPENETTDGNMENSMENYGTLGTLVFKLRFLPERNALVVSVVRCRGLQKQLVSRFSRRLDTLVTICQIIVCHYVLHSLMTLMSSITCHRVSYVALLLQNY